MIRVLFVCHGNICRSTMAQSVFQYMVDQSGLSDQFHIDSAATSREEIGNPPHLQIASLNGHLCHIWRPACDLNGGQPRTH